MTGWLGNESKATDLETAWKNFDPELPLPGDEHPFYIARPGEPLKRLITALGLSAGRSPKFFFTGYRGSGKSTELNRAAQSPKILERYWVVRFSIKDTVDIRNLDYRDILLALGAQMYTQYVVAGGHLESAILEDLDAWKTRTVERLRSKGATFESGAGINLGQFFLSALLKVKTEHETRELIREEIGPRIPELIEKIDEIASNIFAQQRKQVLVLIDDLDKLDLSNARSIFYDNLTALTQPECAIVYTIPVALLYEKEFMANSLFQNAYFLPNIRLHSRLARETKDVLGYLFCQTLISLRMDEMLIENDARDALIALSGGVASDLVFAFQTAISNALYRDSSRISTDDVSWARGQLRNPLLRLINDQDLEVLRDIYRDNPNRLSDPSAHSKLIHIRAALQYDNGLDWFDIHPALEEILAT